MPSLLVGVVGVDRDRRCVHVGRRGDDPEAHDEHEHGKGTRRRSESLPVPIPHCSAPFGRVRVEPSRSRRTRQPRRARARPPFPHLARSRAMIGACAPWCSSSKAGRWRRRDPRAGARPGQVLVAVRACGVCRTDLHVVDGDLREPKLPLVLGHQIVGTVEGAGEGAERFAGRAAGRDPVARLDRRRVPLLPLGPREPLRAGPLHRLSARRRLRGAGGRRRALLLPDPRGLSGPPGGAAALRRADRLPVAAAVRRRGADRLLRLRRLRPHRLPGGRPPGPARVRPHPAGRRRDAALRARARRRLGGRHGGRLRGLGARRGGPARAARRGDHLRPGGELVPVALRAVAPGRDGGLRRAST